MPGRISSSINKENELLRLGGMTWKLSEGRRGGDDGTRKMPQGSAGVQEGGLVEGRVMANEKQLERGLDGRNDSPWHLSPKATPPHFPLALASSGRCS